MPHVARDTSKNKKAVTDLISHGAIGILRVFQTAKGREILVDYDPDVIDGIFVRYKRLARR